MPTNLALLTDLYQLTMAQGYWKLGRHQRRAAFHLLFRRPPFAGGYAIAAGLAPALDYLVNFQFDSSDIEYLRTLNGNDGQPLFDNGFLDYLFELRLDMDVAAVPEGTLTFGNEPILRTIGSILQCQIVETTLLNIINFQTLIATKAARICQAAGDDAVLEFGLRRAQGVDGGLSASRAAYIGGCAATSNVLAGKQFGIPVRGTHAHSWVMSFDSEIEAFESYARAMPNNCVFLVDTYNTIDGIHRAVEVGRQIQKSGHKMVGIRLDSGDLAYLSIEARKILDAAGFTNAVIVASNDLNETVIESLKNQGAQVALWGVGTQLATAFNQPALGGVYKLGALQDADGNWQPKIKLSENVVKTTVPGILQVRRFFNSQNFVCDMIYDETAGVDSRNTIVDVKDTTRLRKIEPTMEYRDLLKPVIQSGKRIGEPEPLDTIRQRVRSELDQLHHGIRRFLNPHEYPVGLDIALSERRAEMITAAQLENTVKASH